MAKSQPPRKPQQPAPARQPVPKEPPWIEPVTPGGQPISLELYCPDSPSQRHEADWPRITYFRNENREPDDPYQYFNVPCKHCDLEAIFAIADADLVWSD